VVRGTARREDLAIAVPNDPPGRGKGDTTDNVIPGNGTVVVDVQNLELKEAREEPKEERDHSEANPPEPPSKLGRVRPAPLAEQADAIGPSGEAHRDAPSPDDAMLIVAA
jgi:hypothetical protein